MINAAKICKTLQDAGHSAYLVGGCVRDSIQGITPKDFDIATSARPEEIEILTSNLGKVLGIGKSFGVIAVVIDSKTYEIATFRRDTECDGRHSVVEQTSCVYLDALRRDFTINSIYYDPISGEYIDSFDGFVDIQKRQLKTVGDSWDRFREDKLRVLRAARFIGRGYTPAPELRAAAYDTDLDNLSKERVWSELKAILSTPYPRLAWRFLQGLPSACNIIPGLGGHLILGPDPVFTLALTMYDYFLRQNRYYTDVLVLVNLFKEQLKPSKEEINRLKRLLLCIQSPYSLSLDIIESQEYEDYAKYTKKGMLLRVVNHPRYRQPALLRAEQLNLTGKKLGDTLKALKWEEYHGKISTEEEAKQWLSTLEN